MKFGSFGGVPQMGPVHEGPAGPGTSASTAEKSARVSLPQSVEGWPAMGPVRRARYPVTYPWHPSCSRSMPLAGSATDRDPIRRDAPLASDARVPGEGEHAAVLVPVLVPVAHRFRSLWVELGRRAAPRQVRDSSKNPRYSSGSRSSFGALTSRGSPVRSWHRPRRGVCSTPVCKR